MEIGLPSLEEIQNFVQLSERLATAGQPFRNQFPLIAAAGFEAVINLGISVPLPRPAPGNAP
jgi:hypothetical protein